jgi:hypothetical protein
MQSRVLGFFAVAWLGLVIILVVEPGIYDSAMRLPAGYHRLADLTFLGAISAFIALLVVGVLRRWAFWLILVAFLFSVLRVPASILELTGVLPPAGPTWYVLFQGFLGLVQVTIGLLMLAGYRRAGPWGSSETGCGISTSPGR